MAAGSTTDTAASRGRRGRGGSRDAGEKAKDPKATDRKAKSGKSDRAGNAKSGSGDRAGTDKDARSDKARTDRARTDKATGTDKSTASGRGATTRRGGGAPAAPPAARDPDLADRERRRARSPIQPLAVSGAVAVILAALYVLGPTMGQDLSAQIAHADFARDHPFTPVDFRWFGGMLPFGYSLVVPLLAAYVPPPLLGALAAVAGTLLTTALFVRTGLRRPVWGGVAAAVTQVANLTEGRVAFAVGLAFGLAALLPLTDRDGGRRVLALLLAFLAAAASPVAGLFVGVAGLTLLVHGRVGDALRLGVGAGLGIVVVSVVFADGGAFLYPGGDAARAAAVTVLVAILAPRWASVLWTGAVIGVAMVAVAYVVDTPVGTNASRLAMLFAIPLVVAAVERVWWQVVAAVVVAAVVQPPVVFGTLAAAGDDVTRPGYYTPLLDRIAADGPLDGRVEIPELTGHWEAAYAARTVPLARGWLRQVDIGLWDDTFYAQAPTADSYRTFLTATATRYVAVPNGPLTFYGQREADLVRTGLPYLAPVWADADWTLYTVTDATPVVASPATDVTLGAAAITFTAPATTSFAVDVRWFRWLQITSPDDGAMCIDPSDSSDRATVIVRTGVGGRYTLTSSFTGDRRHCGDRLGG